VDPIHAARLAPPVMSKGTADARLATSHVAVQPGFHRSYPETAAF
jgi:hypothetical protein